MDITNGNTFYFEFEVQLMELLQNSLDESAIKFISFLSALGEELALILILGFLFWCYDKKSGIKVGICVVTGLVLNPLIKNIAWRRRPYFDHENIKCLRPVEKDADIYDIAAQGFSFPSGHSTNSAVAYGAIARFMKKKILTVLGFLIPLCVGFSRVVVGVHYPTDVLCGWLLGVAIIFFIPLIMEKVGEEKQWLAFLGIFAISCSGLFYCKTSDYFTGLGIMGGFFLAIEFEKRFVHFENTGKIVFCITRIIGGAIVYLALNTLLKLPFSSSFLESGTFIAGIVRVLRYVIVSFMALGVYPMIFRFEKRFLTN